MTQLPLTTGLCVPTTSRPLPKGTPDGNDEGMTDIFLIALASIPLAIALVKQKLDNRGISPRQLREHLSEAELPQRGARTWSNRPSQGAESGIVEP